MQHLIKMTRAAAAGALLAGLLTTHAFAQAQPGPVTGPVITDPATGPITAPKPLDPARQAKITERLDFLLAGYEYFPDRATLDREGSAEEVIAALLGMLDDAKTRPALRIKVVDALGYYGEAASLARLRPLALTAPAAELPVAELRLADSMRHHAIVSLGRASGEAAAGELAALLRDKDLQIQLTAVSALGKHGGQAGRQALIELDKTATSPILKREIKKHIP